MANYRNRKKRKARESKKKDPKKRILIVSEGAVTEPEYYKALNRWKRDVLVDVEVAPEHGVPKTVIDIAKELKDDAELKAKRERDENRRFDEVWCVIDVDDHPYVNDCIQMARDSGLGLALSNPSFELWLLLHFRENPGMQDRKDISKSLKAFIPNYNKHVEFERFKNGFEDALRRAHQMCLDAIRDGENHRNPTTYAHCLARTICREKKKATHSDCKSVGINR